MTTEDFKEAARLVQKMRGEVEADERQSHGLVWVSVSVIIAMGALFSWALSSVWPTVFSITIAGLFLHQSFSLRSRIRERHITDDEMIILAQLPKEQASYLATRLSEAGCLTVGDVLRSEEGHREFESREARRRMPGFRALIDAGEGSGGAN